MTASPPAGHPKDRSESISNDRRCRPAHQSGQGLIEYGLILIVMAVVCVVSLVFFGDQLSSLLSLITSAV